MGKAETHLIVDDNTIRRVNSYTKSHRGGAGPTGPPGAGGASKTTLLTITKQSPSGTVFFVNSGSTHYAFDLEAGYLGLSEAIYLENEAVQIYLRGAKLLKTEHTQWLSQFSFVLKMPVDIGDYLEILT